MSNIEYEIVKELGALSPASKDWQKEVNLLKWNNGDAKIDIRSWTKGHEKMSKGIALTLPEAERLVEILQEYLQSKQ